MPPVTSTCIQCHHPLPSGGAPSPAADRRCLHCGAVQFHLVYPAAFREMDTAGVRMPDSEGASCFTHESAAAENLCDDCGRYLCALCTLPIPRPASNPPDFPQRLCPACYANRMDEEARTHPWDLFQTEYPRYDIMALLLAVAPWILFPAFFLAPVTGSMAIYLSVRNWRGCRTPIRRYRFNFVIAIGMVLFTALFWVAFLAMTVTRILNAP